MLTTLSHSKPPFVNHYATKYHLKSLIVKATFVA